MIQVRIENTSYKIVNEWCDLTIQDAIDYYAIPQPEILRDLTRLFMKDTEEYMKAYRDMPHRDRMITLPEYYGKVLKVMSNIPGDVINRMFWRVRTELYEGYLFKFILGLDVAPNCEPRKIGFFWHDGVKYMMPNDRQMTAVEFCEAADLEILGLELFKNKGEVMARLMAVLCRPEGEKYDEEKIRERIEPFKKLTLDKVWEVDFFLTGYLNGFAQNVAVYLQGEGSRLEKQQSLQDSADLDGTAH